MQWWVGELTDQQRAIVRDVTASMPEPSIWYAYRDDKRRELIALLRGEASAQRIERFLNDWLVEYRDMPAVLERAQTEMRQASPIYSFGWTQRWTQASDTSSSTD